MNDEGGTSSNNETSVFMISDRGEEAAKEIVSLMESLVKVGCRDYLKITFNLPPRLSRRYPRQSLRLATPICLATVLINKVPQYKAFRTVHCTFIRDASNSSDSCSNKTDRSTLTETCETQTTVSNKESRLVDYCQFMSQQLDLLTACLKRIADLAEYSDNENSKQNEKNKQDEVKINKYEGNIKEELSKIEQNKDIGSMDEFTFVLQQLFENFDTITPILETNDACATELLTLVFKCKERINKVEKDLLRFIPLDGEQLSLQASFAKLKDKDNIQSLEEVAIVNDVADVKQSKGTSALTFLTRTKSNNIIKKIKGKKESSACVLLPKGFHIVRATPEVSDEFDLYVLQRDKDIIETRITDRSTVKLNPIVSQPSNLDEDETNSTILNTDLSKSVIDYKPTIAADEVSGNFDSLTIFPAKSNIQNFNVQLPSMVQGTTAEILGNISMISKLIGSKKMKELEIGNGGQPDTIIMNNENMTSKTSIKIKKKRNFVSGKERKSSLNSSKDSSYVEKQKSSRKRGDDEARNCALM